MITADETVQLKKPLSRGNAETSFSLNAGTNEYLRNSNLLNNTGSSKRVNDPTLVPAFSSKEDSLKQRWRDHKSSSIRLKNLNFNSDAGFNMQTIDHNRTMGG
jgi:hypothetical protein